MLIKVFEKIFIKMFNSYTNLQYYWLTEENQNGNII